MSDPKAAFHEFLAPRFWLVWLGLAALRTASLLPFGAQIWLGRRLGALLYRLLDTRREIARRNIGRCFPGLDDGAQQALLKRHFGSLGIGVFETALAWWASDARLAARMNVTGLEHLELALARGNGVILLSAHFTAMDLGGRMLGERIALDVLYRPLGHPLFDEVMRRGRLRAARKMFTKGDLRGMLRSLHEGRAVWFAPDQAHSGPNSVLAPFFSIPAPTNTIASRIAAKSGAAVIPFFPLRERDDRNYHLLILPALENFPAQPEVDAARINALIEEQARIAPEQYLWIHRRFKGSPGYSGEPAMYP